MKDPKAIRKAIMTAKSIATMIDPKFSRVPLPDLGMPAIHFFGSFTLMRSTMKVGQANIERILAHFLGLTLF